MAEKKLKQEKATNSNPLFTYIDSKEYDVIINENNEIGRAHV